MLSVPGSLVIDVPVTCAKPVTTTTLWASAFVTSLPSSDNTASTVVPRLIVPPFSVSALDPMLSPSSSMSPVAAT